MFSHSFRVWSSGIRKEFRIELLLLHTERKEAVEVVQGSDQDRHGSHWKFFKDIQLVGDPGVDPEHTGEIVLCSSSVKQQKSCKLTIQ